MEVCINVYLQKRIRGWHNRKGNLNFEEGE